MKFKEFEKEYTKLISEYPKINIPRLEELDKQFSIQFDINKLEERPNNLTNFIVGNILNFFNNYLNWCYSLKYGNPQSGIINQESSFLNETEKNHLMKVLYKITAISRLSPGIYLEDGKNKIEIISSLYNDWLEIKPFLKELSEKVRSEWQRSYEEFDPNKRQF